MSSTASRPAFGRHTLVAIRAMVLFTLVLGVGYTALITAIGQVALPWQANGSLVTDGAGRVVGSSLIGQGATDASGQALPAYLQPRPSAAGDGWDGTSSGGSNLGPNNPDLVDAITCRQAAIAASDSVAVDAIPADGVTASGSGLDPHVSAAYALEQVGRIASARGVAEADVRQIVESKIQQRDLGFLGEPRVNVLEVNLALDARFGTPVAQPAQP